ncbi:hypothetical protein [Variovorax sp. JS1663]|uniref:hypothetical protein n=1 Tax=Variovorax sp. JS1663 TaxID=1851577 RepID=UPI000B3450F6|nr:hypothetical protein [Variovorax sp. JS1663]OUM00572.1 hypothetical protein A8M77_21140 [Variovorax sp. JS1663]
MAKLQVSAELLLDSLFKGQAQGMRLIGASVEPITQTIELDLEGPAIPNTDRISAICTVERFTVRFEPRL